MTYRITMRMLAKESWIAFYDGQFTTDEDPVEIVKRPVLFGLYAAPQAYERGRWRKIGHIRLNVAPIPIPKQFSYTPLSKTYHIVDESWTPRPASPEECIDLEFAVVVKRLRRLPPNRLAIPALTHI